MVAPVRGLRPVVAERLETAKVPKPTRRTSSPDFRALVTEARKRKAKKLENLEKLPPERIVFGGKKLYSEKDVVEVTKSDDSSNDKDQKTSKKASNKWRQEFFEKRHQSMSLPGRHTSKYGNFLCKYDGKDLSVTCIDGSVTIFHDFKLPRYNEASLVKALEEYGIGRPSTYATIITVIQTRKYVEKKDKALHPTLLGRTVSKQLVAQFADIMDYKFTAGMETKLDKIAEKKAIWNDVLQEFYTPFIEEVNKALQTGERVRIESKIKCPNCGKPMVLRIGKNGSQFLGCSGYPDCKTMMSLNALSEESLQEQSNKPEVCEEKCEKCGSDMIFKIGPYGKYMECTNETCKHRKPYRKSTGVKCPKCGEGMIVERKSKRGTIFYGCDKYPDCDFTLWNEPTGETCPECGSLLVKKVLKKGDVIACSSMKCHYKKDVEAIEQTGD